jgi:hypothetical protein
MAILFVRSDYKLNMHIVSAVLPKPPQIAPYPVTMILRLVTDVFVTQEVVWRLQSDHLFASGLVSQ